MHEHILKIEDSLNRVSAIAHLLSDKAGNLNCSESICRSGLMIQDHIHEAESELEAILAARRAEKGSADEAPGNAEPKPQRSELHLDERRFCRAMSLLTVLLEKTEWSASTASEADTLEIAIAELYAAGGLEQ